MSTLLKLTLPGDGVPGRLLDEIEKALHAYYDDTPLSRAWTLPGQAPKRVWGIAIELVPQDDAVDEDVAMGRNDG